MTGKQVKESTLATVLRATEASKLPPLVWHPLALKDHWAASGEAPAYAVDAQGLVILGGRMSGGVSDTLAFMLPKSARPSRDIQLSVAEDGSATGQLVIVTDGKVFVDVDPDHLNSATALTSLAGVVIPAQ